MKKTILFAAVAIVTTACNHTMKHDASGVFEATELVVNARGTGELINFDIYEGQPVEQGEVLGNIDTLQMCLKRQQLLSGMSAVDKRKINDRTQLAALETQIANMKTEQKRFKRLVDAGAIPEKNYTDLCYQIDGMELTLSAKREQFAQQNGAVSDQLTGMEAQLAEINYAIANCYIKAPITGTIQTKYAEQGEFAAPGRILFRVANTNRMTLRTYLSSAQLSEIKVNDTVRVFADYGDGEREYTGRVAWISDKAEFTPKNIQTRSERQNLVYAVKISVENDGWLKKGMYGEIDLKP